MVRTPVPGEQLQLALLCAIEFPWSNKARAGGGRENSMGDIRLFHVTHDGAHELPSNPIPYERELQNLFEKHLLALIRIDFLASEHSTGQRHSRRIDTLGIDDAGRPVVVEYKRRQDENIINQGLDYLDWLEDHQAEFRELVRTTLDDGRAVNVDFRSTRLLCIAREFLRQDTAAARNSRRRIELLRYRRYGEAHVALEWVYGGEDAARAPVPIETPSPAAGEGRSVAQKRSAATRQYRPDSNTPANGVGTFTPDRRQPRVHTRTSPGDIGGIPDYSTFQHWNKASEKTLNLFLELETLVGSLGSVRTDTSRTLISFKCLASRDSRSSVIAYVTYLYAAPNVGIRLLLPEKLVKKPLEDNSRRVTMGKAQTPYREITIRDGNDIGRAEPLLRTAYDSLSAPPGHATAP